MKLEKDELESLEADIKAIRLLGIETVRGNPLTIKRLERLLDELKEVKADD